MKKTENYKPKYSKADKNGILLIVVLFAVAVILAFNVNKIAKNDTSTTATTESSTSQTTTETTTAATTSAPASTTESTTNELPQNDVKPSDTTAPAKSEEMSKEDILKKVAEGVNSLKSSNASFKATKNQVMNIDLIDCSVPKFTGVVNSVIQRFLGDEVLDYDFTNGIGIDPEEGGEITSKEAIPPTNKDFTLTMEGLQDAYMKKEGDSTIYTIVVVPEKGTLENPRPPHHSSACDTMDISLVEIPMGAITRADYDYAGAIVSVSFDKNGKVIKYYEKLSIAGVGEGRAIGITGSATIEGFMEETWDIAWK